MAVAFSLKYPRVLACFLPYLFWTYPRLRRYAKHPEKTPLKTRSLLVHELTMRLLRDFRCDINVIGKENLESAFSSGRSLLLTPNHLSDADPLLLYSLLEKPISFVAKEETASYIGVGTVIKSTDGLFLPRKDLRASFEVMKTLQTRLEEPGRAYVIFPEGTRNKDLADYKPLPFHAGSYSGALKSHSLIVPIAIYGTQRVLSAGPNPKRIPISISFLPPLDPEGAIKGKSTSEVASLCQEEIAEEAKRLIALDEAYIERGFQRIRLKKGDLWGKLR